MNNESTKERILSEALKLFSKNGYDAVSVEQIATAVGIKAPSLYNHFKSKQAIFNAITNETATRYSNFTSSLSVHLQNAPQDQAVFNTITADALFEKVSKIFIYSLHDETLSNFRKMMTIEQFRSPELSKLYTERFVDKMVNYHAELFKVLIKNGVLKTADANALALMYVSPVLTLISICDRQPEKEEEALKILKNHVQLFYKTYNNQ